MLRSVSWLELIALARIIVCAREMNEAGEGPVLPHAAERIRGHPVPLHGVVGKQS